MLCVWSRKTVMSRKHQCLSQAALFIVLLPSEMGNIEQGGALLGVKKSTDFEHASI